MAIYYWVGGSTATSGSYNQGAELSSATGSGTSNFTWLRAFDWNNPKNWRTKVGSGNFAYWETPSDCPGPSDIAWFASPETLGVTWSSLPQAKAPCLWGGASVAGVTTTWIGAGTSGANQTSGGAPFNGALQVMLIGVCGGKTQTQYPFKTIGLPNGGLASAYTEGSPWSPFYELEQLGYTPQYYGLSGGSGASWKEWIDAVVATGGTKTRYDTLTLKARDVSTMPVFINGKLRYFGYGNFENDNPIYPYFSENVGSINVTLLKHLQTVPPSGSSAATGSVLVSNVIIGGPAHATVRGYASSVKRLLNQLSPAIDQTVTYGHSARSSLLLSGATVGSLEFRGTGMLADASTNIAQAALFLPRHHTVQLQNKFNRNAVLAEIGGTASNTAGTPNLQVLYSSSEDVGTVIGLNTGFALRGIIIGSDGATVSGDRFEFINPVISNTGGSAGGDDGAGRFDIQFGGSVVLNSMRAENSLIRGFGLVPVDPSSVVDIGSLQLAQGCTLDFSAVPQFDSWNFGTQLSNCEIQGGIIFETEDSFIKGSQGVRLFNDQIVLSGQLRTDAVTKRSGASTATTPTAKFE